MKNIEKYSYNAHKPIICIDIGNISIDICIFETGRIVKRSKVLNNDIPKYINFIHNSGLKHIEYACICSVVPLLRKKVILELKKSHIRSISVFSKKRLSANAPLIKGAYQNLGEDRQVGLWMANRMYKTPLILVDLGSAITIDVLTDKGIYAGGIILPGFKMWTKALRMGTALLPDTDYRRLRMSQFLGKSTKSCIRSGLCFGLVAMINGLLSDIKRQHGRHCSVVLTGGDLEKVSSRLTHKHIKNDSLVLRGLYELFCNRGEVR